MCRITKDRTPIAEIWGGLLHPAPAPPPALAHTPVSLLFSRGALPQKPSSEVLGWLCLSVLRAVCGARVLCQLLAVSLYLPCSQPFYKLQPTPMMTSYSQWNHISACPFVYLAWNSRTTCVGFWFKTFLYPLITILVKCAVDHPVVTLFGYDLAWGCSQYLQSCFYGK